VTVATRDFLTREADVDDLLGERAVEVRLLEHVATLRDGPLDPLAKGVEHGAAVAVPNLAKRLLQLALPAEVAHAGIVELDKRRSARNGAQSLVFEPFGVHSATVSSAFAPPSSALCPIRRPRRYP
jgi:hypothetical protein